MSVLGAALAAGIAATASTAGTIYNNYQANLQSDRAFYRQQDLMDKQLDQNKQLHQSNLQTSYETDIKYNSPSAQMKRLQEAGLNPYLLSQHENLIAPGASPATAGHGMQGVPSVQQANLQPLNFDSIGRQVSQLLAVGSEIKRNDAESFSKIVDALPKLGESLGWDNARKAAKDMLGMFGISNSQRERQLEGIINGIELENRSKAVKASLDEQFGVRDANQKWALGEQALSESFARIGKMSSDAKVNDQQINKLASDIIRNVADAWKLRKEGEKFVADAKTVNALREFVVSQAKSTAQQMSLSSFMSGADPVSPVHDLKYSQGYVKDVIDRDEMIMHQSASKIEYFLNKWLGEYLKVSAGGSAITDF